MNEILEWYTQGCRQSDKCNVCILIPISVCFGFPVFTRPIKWEVMLVILGVDLIILSLAMLYTTWELVSGSGVNVSIAESSTDPTDLSLLTMLVAFCPFNNTDLRKS